MDSIEALLPLLETITQTLDSHAKLIKTLREKVDSLETKLNKQEQLTSQKLVEYGTKSS